MNRGWSPRLKRHDIIRLYARDAEGIYDEDLINEVGYGLLARCEDILKVTLHHSRDWRGHQKCPNCRASLKRDFCAGERPVRPMSLLHTCPACGWAGERKQHKSTCRQNGLFCHGCMVPCIRRFVDGFPVARTPQQRMVMIDTLIHYYHLAASGLFVPCPLLEGSPEEVTELLDGISQGRWAFHRRQCPRCGKPLFGRRPTWKSGDYCSTACYVEAMNAA